MSEEPGEYDEWRVQADHRDPDWRESIPPYDFTWSTRINPAACNPDAETAVKRFLAGHFSEGMTNIRVSRRLVVVGSWVSVKEEDL